MSNTADSSRIPALMTLMGYHSDAITAKNVAGIRQTFAAARTAQAQAITQPQGVVRATLAPPSEAVAPITNAAAAAPAPGPGAAASAPVRRVSSSVYPSSAPSHAVPPSRAMSGIPGNVRLNVVNVDRAAAKGGMASSMAIGTSRLRAQEDFVPLALDLQAIANSSTGGNGLPRPYGRFLAPREGNGLAIWERLPPHLQRPDSPTETPMADEAAMQARNVTRFNVQRGAYNALNARTDLYEIPMGHMPGGKDVLTKWEGDLRERDRFSRKRPDPSQLANPRQGYTSDLLRRPGKSASDGSMGVRTAKDIGAGATFLVQVPEEMPHSVRVDDSRDFERAFLHPLRGFQKGRKVKKQILIEDTLKSVS
ncbi:unnamed protein product [Pedinophyceae sp. YPF-701]|nr:unnamed protein product [Pedinophyceae sp. YPF-701]